MSGTMLVMAGTGACDYRGRFGLADPRPSCLGILAEVLAPCGIPQAMIPDPFNIFQHSKMPRTSASTRGRRYRARATTSRFRRTPTAWSH
jgi:hypothetical protein